MRAYGDTRRREKGARVGPKEARRPSSGRPPNPDSRAVRPVGGSEFGVCRSPEPAHNAHVGGREEADRGRKRAGEAEGGFGDRHLMGTSMGPRATRESVTTAKSKRLQALVKKGRHQ